MKTKRDKFEEAVKQLALIVFGISVVGAVVVFALNMVITLQHEEFPSDKDTVVYIEYVTDSLHSEIIELDDTICVDTNYYYVYE